jgi:hypothetical protein
MKKVYFVFVLLFSFLFLNNIYTQNLSDYYKYIKENGEIKNLPYNIETNKVDSYTKYLMVIGEIKNVSELAEEDKEKYNIILKFISENDDINKYYYDINITIEINEENIQMPLSEYTKYFDIYENKKIIEIVYTIFYEDYFYIIYDAMEMKDGCADFIHGDPTGKCFMVIFNEKGEFKNQYRW